MTLIYYWDTTVFLALVQNEERPEGEMQGVRAVAKLVDDGKATLITSALTFAEILRAKCGDEAFQTFRRLFDRSNVKAISADHRIAVLAGQLRDHYIRLPQNDGYRKLRTPDAIHVATAVIYKARQLHTFDHDQLQLDPTPGGYDLEICRPPAGQLVLPGIEPTTG
ncbi:MAG: type II toxin-antitoxin system VapC family toxin [Armatimonadetes bacterium]|nr:type II toxin-antitoxin system VapC family toxin [Armatimonadota bacterium]